MTLRRLFFWLHLSVGLVAGLLIAFLALTGSIISFQSQIVAFAERHIHAEHPADAVCVAPSALLANAAALSTRPLTSLTLFTDPTRPAQVATGPDGSVLLADACTGRILGSGANRTRIVLTAVRELHHQATFAGVQYKTLRALKNAAALFFVFLVLSGLYIWFPRKLTLQQLRPSVFFRPGLHGRAREWNLHNIAGFWLCLPLLAISTTGVIMAYPWANNLLFRAAGDTPPPPRREAPTLSVAISPRHVRRDAGNGAHPGSNEVRPGGEQANSGANEVRTGGDHTAPPLASAYTALDVPITRARAFLPASTSITLRLPAPRALASTPALVFQLALNDRGQSMNRDQLTLSTADASVLKFEPFAKASRGRRWRITARYLHTGELFGAPGQAVALLAALGALLLVWTGFSLALRRLAAFRRRRRNRPHPATATKPNAQQPIQVS